MNIARATNTSCTLEGHSTGNSVATNSCTVSLTATRTLVQTQAKITLSTSLLPLLQIDTHNERNCKVDEEGNWQEMQRQSRIPAPCHWGSRVCRRTLLCAGETPHLSGRLLSLVPSPAKRSLGTRLAACCDPVDRCCQQTCTSCHKCCSESCCDFCMANML